MLLLFCCRRADVVLLLLCCFFCRFLLLLLFFVLCVLRVFCVVALWQAVQRRKWTCRGRGLTTSLRYESWGIISCSLGQCAASARLIDPPSSLSPIVLLIEQSLIQSFRRVYTYIYNVSPQPYGENAWFFFFRVNVTSNGNTKATGVTGA